MSFFFLFSFFTQNKQTVKAQKEKKKNSNQIQMTPPQFMGLAKHLGKDIFGVDMQ